LRKRFAKDNAEMQTVIDNIIETSSFSVQNLRDSVWAINPQNDTMEKLFGRMCSFASELLNAKDIKVTFNPSIEETEVLLQKINIKMEQRRAIYLIFKEIVHNILKHSEATETTIEVKKVRFGVELVIVDNGKGFDLSKADEGNGMKTLQSRAKAALIDLKIDTNLGQGTAVKLFIPEI
jgi:signal transduction histidine kinase